MQRLEELSVTSSRLENEIKSLRRAAYPDSKVSDEMSHPSSYDIIIRQQQQQQQQHLHNELLTKVCNKCTRIFGGHISVHCGPPNLIFGAMSLSLIMPHDM